MKKGYNYNVSLQEKALEFFMENPYNEIYLREYGRRTGISLNSCQRFLGMFLKQGLIKEERKGNLRFFKGNVDSVVFRQHKILHSLRKIEHSGVIEFIKNKGVSHFVVFGSAAEGLDDKDSDLDIVIIGGNKDILSSGIRKFESKINRQITAHFFSWAEWKRQAKDNTAFYMDVITKGISLIGGKPIV